jgi:predicted nucleic acid-binding protein
MCCLKRPFDDQSQPRIRLESEAVLALMSAPAEFVHSIAHDLENDQNPLPWRAARVRAWLGTSDLTDLPDQALAARASELVAFGFKSFDALHIASAELSGCDAFCTTDDRLQAAARRHASSLRLRVLNPVDLTREMLP